MRFVFALLAAALVTAVYSAEPLVLKDPSDGSRVELKLTDPATHVVFFATWCPPCVDELDRLTQLEARWEERGYRLILVAVAHRHTEARLKAFASGRTVPGRLLFDESGAMEKRLRGSSLPTHLLFDATGREIARADSLDGELDDRIKTLLVEPRPRRTP